MILHQSKSQGATSIAAAKAIYSQAKPIIKQPAWRPRQPDAVQFKQLRWSVPRPSVKLRPRKTSQAMMFQEEHSKYLRSLEEQAFGEESRSHHNILSSCQASLCHSLQLLGGSGCLVSLAIRTSTSIPPLILPPRTPPAEEQPSTATPPMPTPKQSPRLKRWLSLPELMGNTPLCEITLAAALGGPPYPKK